MEEKTKLKVLQYYRHDVMNELQLVQGYLHMRRIDTVKQKVNEWVHNLNEERKLFFTNASQFILWVIMFNHTYNQIRLTYTIETEANLSEIDHLLVSHCQQFIQVIEKNSKTELYDTSLNISNQSPSKVMFTLRISGTFTCKEKIINKLQAVGKTNKLLTSITKEKSAIICMWTYII